MPEIKTICDFYILDGGSITLDSQQNILHINCFDSEIPPQIESQATKLPFGCKLLYYTPEGVSLTHDQPQITKARLWFKDEINFPLIHQTFADLPVQIFEWRGENRPDHPKFPEFDVFAEFVPLNSGKEKAIRTYADAHRLPLTDIIAIGDGDNDCEMIKQFNGYMIKDSTLDRLRTPLKTTPSLSALKHRQITSSPPSVRRLSLLPAVYPLHDNKSSNKHRQYPDNHARNSVRSYKHLQSLMQCITDFSWCI